MKLREFLGISKNFQWDWPNNSNNKSISLYVDQKQTKGGKTCRDLTSSMAGARVYKFGGGKKSEETEPDKFQKIW
jgi:hypothetical protein